MKLSASFVPRWRASLMACLKTYTKEIYPLDPIERDLIVSGDAIKESIIQELFTAIRRCDGSPELLSIIGSYGDTLEDSEILNLLRAWNQTGVLLHGRQ